MPAICFAAVVITLWRLKKIRLSALWVMLVNTFLLIIEAILALPVFLGSPDARSVTALVGAAACLALFIYHNISPSDRKAAKNLIITGLIVSSVGILTGVTAALAMLSIDKAVFGMDNETLRAVTIATLGLNFVFGIIGGMLAVAFGVIGFIGMIVGEIMLISGLLRGLYRLYGRAAFTILLIPSFLPIVNIVIAVIVLIHMKKKGKLMNILVVGGGGREHAIVRALSKSPRVEKIYAAPGNGGISALAECFPVKATDIDGIVGLAKKLAPDYVFVAPDDPLVMGMVDELNKNGFKTFGPRANAAILEGSKVFSKGLMKKYNIPTARYEVFTDADSAVEYVKEQNSYPAVIKCDGLALGKGVIIAKDFAEAKEAIESMLIGGKFGKSGSEIVIEEFMTGPEVTVLAFTDGISVKPMVSSMDHKRAYDNDEGLNTGGMGTIAPNPLYTPEIAQECMEKIFVPTIKAMAAEGRPFKGCLYFGLMLTPNGAKVIEYNCRFGDPETQVVLPLLKTDLTEIMDAIWDEKLGELEIEWESGSCACVVMASGGYPEKYPTGLPISGFDEKGQLSDGSAFIYHAGTKLENGVYLTAGGRVLGVTAAAESLQGALDKAYSAIKEISFENAHFRTDIGKRALNGSSGE